jgi:hypothetical protein
MEARRLHAIPLCALLLACEGRDIALKRLPSGHSYRILQAGQIKFEKTGETAALLVFETDRRPDDLRGIEAEALELWEAFRPDVDKTPQRMAIVQANSPKRALLLRDGQSIAGFTFEKQADGTWIRK